VDNELEWMWKEVVVAYLRHLSGERERERDYENQNYIFKIKKRNRQNGCRPYRREETKERKIALILKKFSLYFQENVSKKATQ